MTAHRGLESLNFLDTSNGSRIVITSRDRSILDRLGVQHRHLELHGFSDDNSYTLFCNHAFNAEEAPSDLEKYARDLAGRCGGVPFVLEVLGKAMRSKRQPAQWKYMLDKLSRGVLDERARILELLRLSYDQLSTVQQRRFLALVVLDSLEIPRHFLPIAWQSMDLLQLDKYIDDEVARCAFNEALEELVSYSLAPSHPYLGQNQWIKELAWHIVKEEMQSLEQQVESEEQNQEDGDNSSTYFKVAVISESLVISEQFKSPAVPSSLRLLMAHDTKLLQTQQIKSTMVLPSLGLLMANGTKLLKSNIDKLLQLRFLHLDGHCESRIASIGELSELVGLRLRIRGMGDLQHYGKIEEALGNLVKMEDLELRMDDCRHDVDLSFLRRMPNLRYLKIAARRATSGSNIKHCLKMRSLRLQVHLADAHLNDVLHPESSLERALIESMPRESASGYNGFIPATLKFFYVTRWTSGDTKSNLSEPVFSSCEIIKLSMCLPMKSLPESFGRLHSLQQLSLDGSGVLAHLTSLDRFPELHGLFFKDCAMPRLGILFLPVLRTLEIFNCKSLVEIQGIDAPKLEELRIFNCKSLVEIREINAPELSTLQVDGCDALVQIQGLTTPSAVPAEWYGHSSSSSTQLQHISCASPFSNLVSLTISLARESLPECLSRPETLAKLQWLSLDGMDLLLQLPSFARLPRLSGLWLDNCAVQCLPLAAGPPGFPALEFLGISRFRCMVKIQGLYATHLRGLHLKDCPSLVEIQGLDCPGLRRVDQSQLGGGGYLPDMPWHNQAATIYRQGNAGNTSGL